MSKPVLYIVVVPNPWAGDRYWAMNHLVPDHKEKVQSLFYFQYFSEIIYFEKLQWLVLHLRT